MEYQEVLSFIGGTKKFGKKLGLERPRRLMGLLGNPQDSLRFVHIAGTNGKGSTAAFLSEIMMDAGYRTGLFTSPFLYEFNERMRIDGKMIADDTLCAVMERVKHAADELEEQGDDYPTEFELVTAAAFCYFAGAKCDIVILETGLGGRFDTTNIIHAPEVSVITSISLDHTQYLGDTLEKIAFEKCGIIKEGGHCVCYGMQPPEALGVITETAKQKNNVFSVWSREELTNLRMSTEGNAFAFRGTDYRMQMRGEYQIYNAATAICTVQILTERGWRISQENIQNGIAKTRWRGRMETLSEKPLMIADGSHNPDGVRAFARSASVIAGDRKMVCVVAMMKDKDYDSCLLELSHAVQSIVLTTLPRPRAASCEELTKSAQGRFCEIAAVPDCREAIRLALERAGENGAVFLVGSLYLIGDAKEAIGEIKQHF